MAKKPAPKANEVSRIEREMMNDMVNTRQAQAQAMDPKLKCPNCKGR